METKQAVQEVTGKWVDVVEEPCWVSLKAQRVQEPAVSNAGGDGQFSSAFELTYRQDQQVTFDLAELRAIITIHGAKAEKD
jgi:hypothetical protein